jgi:hypothetical protein
MKAVHEGVPSVTQGGTGGGYTGVPQGLTAAEWGPEEGALYCLYRSLLYPLYRHDVRELLLKCEKTGMRRLEFVGKGRVRVLACWWNAGYQQRRHWLFVRWCCRRGA